MEQQLSNYEIARSVIIGYLQHNASLENDDSLKEVMLIKADEKVLKDHIKTLADIFNKALEEIEKEEK